MTVAATRSLRVLQKQMVCRRPTDEDLRDRRPIVLTERDLELLADVHNHGFLTAELIEIAHFPDDAHQRRSPSSCCQDRLRSLWLWGYVDRIEPPIARVLGGRRPYLYALGRRGVPHVQTQLDPGDPPVRLRRLDRLNDLFVEHDLRAAGLWACLTAAVRNTRLEELEWEPERSLRARKLRVKDPDSGRWLPFLPDALFRLVYPDGTCQAVVLEIDMGTVELRRFRRKIRAIECFHAQGLTKEHFDLSVVEVWVLAPSAERREHLRRTAWPEVPTHREAFYLFGTFDDLTPERVTWGEFLHLDGERRRALHSDAFAEPDDEEATS